MKATFSSESSILVELEFGGELCGGGKLEYLKKNLEARREPTTNSTHIWHRAGIEPASHIAGGRQELSPLRHPCSPEIGCKTLKLSAESWNWIARIILISNQTILFVLFGINMHQQIFQRLHLHSPYGLVQFVSVWKFTSAYLFQIAREIIWLSELLICWWNV